MVTVLNVKLSLFATACHCWQLVAIMRLHPSAATTNSQIYATIITDNNILIHFFDICKELTLCQIKGVHLY